MRNLAELQAECAQLGITVESNGRPSKETWIEALRRHYWNLDHPGRPLPAQVRPMLLSDWNGLDAQAVAEMEADQHAWIVQPKLDGVRALLHVDKDGVRITGRCVSEVTYRLTEHQHNLSHLITGLDAIVGTILDGELVCPLEKVDTGCTTTASALQAAVAILATRPENAERIQRKHGAWLRLHVFDILKFGGQDATRLPLHDRLALLTKAIDRIENPYVEIVPHFVVNKPAVHERIIEQGDEGTVWKKSDQPYEPARRVAHWIKRKRSIEIEAFVTGFKPGSPKRGHSSLVGALEFSACNGDGTTRPIAWVSNFTDAERLAMTQHNADDQPTLNPVYLGRRAIIAGQDQSMKSRRIRHAKIKRWLVPQGR